MKIRFLSFLLNGLALTATAATAPFTLTIDGEHIDVNKTFELRDVSEGETAIDFDFQSALGKNYNFSLQYVKLPDNRSYPTNLDITLKDESGNKLGYLFWANNGVDSLQRIGVFGFITDVNGRPMDVRLTFASRTTGKLRVADLGDERLVQDTLIANYGFQMIRPVILPQRAIGLRSQTYRLDDHPYAVNYSLKDIDHQNVEFQYNFYRTDGSDEHLLQRIYYQADSLATLREGMFAGKYFDPQAGTVKLVYYPALGQTQPTPDSP